MPFAGCMELATIDVIRFRRDWLSKDINGVWRVMLYRQKNGNPVYVAIPNQAAEAVLAVPPMSEAYFFWSGNGRPETAVRGWRRSLEHVYDAAKLERNGKKLRAHTHMLRHTFAIEKLNAGALLEDVSLLLAQHSIKITGRLFAGIKEIQWISYPELGLKQTCQRLVATIDVDADWVRQHTRLAGKAHDWESNQHNDSFLLRGMALQEALQWLAKEAVVNEPKILPIHEEYIRASQEWQAGEINRLMKLQEQEAQQAKRFEALAALEAEQAKEREFVELGCGDYMVHLPIWR